MEEIYKAIEALPATQVKVQLGACAQLQSQIEELNSQCDAEIDAISKNYH